MTKLNAASVGRQGSIDVVKNTSKSGKNKFNQNIQNVFTALDKSNDGFISRENLKHTLEKCGILNDDPRLDEMRDRLNTGKDELNIGEFVALSEKHFSLFERAVKDKFVVPNFPDFVAELTEIFDICKEIKDGAVADYIPQLGRVDPELFGMGTCTVDGQRASIGNANQRYCVQSTCKPINYAMALTLNGAEKVHQHVGREPSGRSFNELTLSEAGLPHNPMINAGSIMSCSLIKPELELSDRFDYVMQTWTALSGGTQPGYNNPVYLSEKATADRNFALAYFMQEKGAFPKGTNLLETLDFYFQSCSLEVTAESMSVVAATFANAGVCPLTNERIFSEETVRNCLSLMGSCGMYDFSGEFAFTIGVPAKSGVSGALMVVIPNVAGFAIWSPRLDKLGNSVRGIEFCRHLVNRFSFHNFDGIGKPSSKKDPTTSVKQTQSDNVFQLISAASNGDLQELARLIAHGADINAADYDGRTPLHLAAAEGKEMAVSYLLNHGANAKAKDRWGATPMTDAKNHGHKSIESRLKKAEGIAA
ncbi:MAG: glutaminase A [Aestuariibacter sp.]